MEIRFGTMTRTVTGLATIAMLASACTPRDDAKARNESAAGTIATRDTMTRPIDRNGWTDESILAYLQAANADEVKVNELAAKKATSPAVREFAKKMVSDHRAGLKTVEAMIGQAKMTVHDTVKHETRMKHDTTMKHDSVKVVDTTRGKAGDVMDKLHDELKDLSDKKAGADWDKDYIDMQIDEHKEVLEKLQDAAKSTANKDLQALLVKMTGEVQEHVTKAEQIKASFK